MLTTMIILAIFGAFTAGACTLGITEYGFDGLLLFGIVGGAIVCVVSICFIAWQLKERKAVDNRLFIETLEYAIDQYYNSNGEINYLAGYTIEEAEAILEELNK